MSSRKPQASRLHYDFLGRERSDLCVGVMEGHHNASM